MRPPHRLRQAGPADAAAVATLTQSAYAAWVPILGRKPRPMLADYDLAVAEHRVDLLEIEGQLAALIEMSAEPDHLLIVNLAVAPAYQGQGFGSLLLRHAEAVARELGLPMLRLYTNKLMARNLALYQRRGYAIEREGVTQTGTTVYLGKPAPAAG